MQTPAEAPWYRHGWVWFIVLLPASVVVASFLTLYIALTNPPSLVREDWYRDGLGVNRRLAESQRARELGLAATLHLDAAGGALQLRIHPGTALGPRLELALVHPTEAALDRVVVLQRESDGDYRARLDARIDGRRRLLLTEPGAAQPWQLHGSLPARGASEVDLLPAAD